MEIPVCKNCWSVIDDIRRISSSWTYCSGGSPGVAKPLLWPKLGTNLFIKIQIKLLLYILGMILPRLQSVFREVDQITKEEESRIL